MEVTLPENYMGQASTIYGTFASIQNPGVDPSTVEVILSPESGEATLNPETLDGFLTRPGVKIVSPDASISCNPAVPNTSAEIKTGVLPITSKIDLAHSIVPEVHLQVQPPSDLFAKVDVQEESVQSGCRVSNEERAGEVSAGVEFVPDLSFKSSSLVYVSDFTEDSDNVHEDNREGREGGDRDQEIRNRISQIGAANNDALNMAALENESLDKKLEPTEVRDEIEAFDEKVARVKAKLDLENSKEAKAVEAVMAGLKEKYSQSGGVARCEDGQVENEEKVVVGKHVHECVKSVIIMPHAKDMNVVEANTEAPGRLESREVDAGLEDGKKVDDQEEVERHVQECIESVIEQGRGNLVQALEDDAEGHIQEGGVDVGHIAKRKLRRQRCSWL